MSDFATRRNQAIFEATHNLKGLVAKAKSAMPKVEVHISNMPSMPKVRMPSMPSMPSMPKLPFKKASVELQAIQERLNMLDVQIHADISLVELAENHVPNDDLSEQDRTWLLEESTQRLKLRMSLRNELLSLHPSLVINSSTSSKTTTEGVL